MFSFQRVRPIAMLFLLAILACSNAFAQDIGIQMGSMRQMADKGPEATLARLKEIGITEIEGGLPRGIKLEEYKKLLKKYDLKVIATGVGFPHLENSDSTQKVIKRAKDLGARYVVCYWIPHEGDNFTFGDMKKAVDVFNKAGKLFAENGLTFSYHAHGYEFREYEGGDGTMFEYMMAKTDPRYVTFQMDVFWIKNPGQDPAALLRKYPDRWKSLHLKDRRHGTPDTNTGRQDKESNVVLGTGDVNIAEVMKAAREIGIKHYFIEDESSRALEQVPQSVAYLKTLGAGKSKK